MVHPATDLGVLGLNLVFRLLQFLRAFRGGLLIYFPLQSHVKLANKARPSRLLKGGGGGAVCRLLHKLVLRSKQLRLNLGLRVDPLAQNVKR